MKICGISKSFGEKRLFYDFSLDVPEGTVTVIQGPSGRGKTTLFRMILGLESPDSGSIEVSGRVSALFQEDRLLENMSVMNNLLLVSDDRKRIVELLGKVGLGAEARSRVYTLSGGMKRRVSLVRALLSEYDTLLLDEPFVALDDSMKARCAALVLEMTAGRTLLVITHDEADATLLKAELIVRL